MARDVKKIATEIMTNGPVGADFTVYTDFTSYRSGKLRQKSYIQACTELDLHETFL